MLDSHSHQSAPPNVLYHRIVCLASDSAGATRNTVLTGIQLTHNRRAEQTKGIAAKVVHYSKYIRSSVILVQLEDLQNQHAQVPMILLQYRLNARPRTFHVILLPFRAFFLLLIRI